MSRLVITPSLLEFVFLRAASSLPVALHPASRRRSYLRLRGLGLPRHGLPPCRCGAFTGALIPACAGMTVGCCGAIGRFLQNHWVDELCRYPCPQGEGT